MTHNTIQAALREAQNAKAKAHSDRLKKATEALNRVHAAKPNPAMSWGDVADNKLCPASPNYDEPHKTTDNLTCDECGAEVDPPIAWDVTTSHTNCAECDKNTADAHTYAKVTGSTKATYTTQDHDNVTHTATVTRKK